MGVSHIMLKVKDLASSKAFFTAALAPLGYKVGIEFPGMVAFGVPSTGHFDFWLQSTDGKETQGIHLAFNGNSEEEVKAFYDAALLVYPLLWLASMNREGADMKEFIGKQVQRTMDLLELERITRTSTMLLSSRILMAITLSVFTLKENKWRVGLDDRVSWEMIWLFID